VLGGEGEQVVERRVRRTEAQSHDVLLMRGTRTPIMLRARTRAGAIPLGVGPGGFVRGQPTDRGRR
jgi:hypothetical protein